MAEESKTWEALDLLHSTPKQIWQELHNMGKRKETAYIPAPPEVVNKVFQALFKCQRGGACCTRENANQDRGIGIALEELEQLAALKGLTVREFQAAYCTKRSDTPEGWSPYTMNYPCPFYAQEGATGVCTIHQQRPLSCKVFPLELSETPQGLQLGVQQHCPGGRLATYIMLTKLQKELKTRRGKASEISVQPGM